MYEYRMASMWVKIFQYRTWPMDYKLVSLVHAQNKPYYMFLESIGILRREFIPLLEQLFGQTVTEGRSVLDEKAVQVPADFFSARFPECYTERERMYGKHGQMVQRKGGWPQRLGLRIL